jgi:hypothetical protein
MTEEGLRLRTWLEAQVEGEERMSGHGSTFQTESRELRDALRDENTAEAQAAAARILVRHWNPVHDACTALLEIEVDGIENGGTTERLLETATPEAAALAREALLRHDGHAVRGWLGIFNLDELLVRCRRFLDAESRQARSR